MPDIMWDAPASPDEVTFAIRQIPLRSELVLSSLANITYSESHTVRWGEVTRRNRLAKYRAFDGPVAKSARDDAADRAIRLAPFSNSLDLGEYERLVIEFERMAGGNRRVLADALYDDAENLTTSMHNRVEKALATTLYTGVFDVNENGYRGTADFGMAAANKFTAAVPWTTSATAKAGDDLRAMGKRYLTSAGVRAGRLITSEAVIDSLLTNAQVVAEAIGTLAGRTYINRDELDNWLRNNRLPQLITEYETSFYNDETGLEERALPEDRIILAPANLGDALEFRYGLSATALELIRSPQSEMTFSDGPGIVGLAVKQGVPFRQFTYVDAVGLPLLLGAKQVVVGDVL